MVCDQWGFFEGIWPQWQATAHPSEPTCLWYAMAEPNQRGPLAGRPASRAAHPQCRLRVATTEYLGLAFAGRPASHAGDARDSRLGNTHYRQARPSGDETDHGGGPSGGPSGASDTSDTSGGASSLVGSQAGRDTATRVRMRRTMRTPQSADSTVHADSADTEQTPLQPARPPPIPCSGRQPAPPQLSRT